MSAAARAPEEVALVQAVEAHEAIERDVRDAEACVRAAQQREAAARAKIGAAVRGLRASMGMSADQMSRQDGFGSDGLREYVRFEDTGELSGYVRKSIVTRLLAAAAQRRERAT